MEFFDANPETALGIGCLALFALAYGLYRYKFNKWQEAAKLRLSEQKDELSQIIEEHRKKKI